MQAQGSKRLTRKGRELRPPGFALPAILKRKLETDGMSFSIIRRVLLGYKSHERQRLSFKWEILTPVMPNEVVTQDHVGVTFTTVVPSCKIEWEMLILVVGDQNEWFLCLTVLYEGIDGRVTERLVIRLHRFRSRLSATKRGSAWRQHAWSDLTRAR